MVDKNDSDASEQKTKSATQDADSKTASPNNGHSILPNLKEASCMAKAVFCGLSQGIKQAVSIYKENRGDSQSSNMDSAPKDDKQNK